MIVNLETLIPDWKENYKATCKKLYKGKYEPFDRIYRRKPTKMPDGTMVNTLDEFACWSFCYYTNEMLKPAIKTKTDLETIYVDEEDSQRLTNILYVTF